MESSLETSRLQDIEMKKEVLDSFEFDEESYDFINDVKQEPYDDQNGLEPINDVTVIREEDVSEKKVDSLKKENLPFSNEKRNDKPCEDNTHLLQTEFVKVPMGMDPVKKVTLQVGLESKVDFCKTCKRSFFIKSMFNQHLRNNMCKQKPYFCHLCERSYSEENILSMHQVIVHGSNEIVNNYCIKKYSKLTSPKKPENLKCSSKLVSLNLPNKDQNCVVCNRVFSSKHDLNNHKNHSLMHRVNVLVKRSTVQ